MMRTKTRFAILFACIGAAVMATGVAAIYSAVGRAAAESLPARAEALLDEASRRAVDDRREEGARLEEATGSLIEARALLAENRIMARDAVVALAIRIAAILAAVMTAATLAFFLLSRLLTRGLDDLAAGAVLAQGDRTHRFPRYSDPDLDAAGSALNDLLDLVAEQERRLAEASKLEGWREVASFLAHQLKNPLAALRIAAQNGSIALGRTESSAIAKGPVDGRTLALESLDVVQAEAKRLAALIDRFRDLAPSSLESYTASREADLVELLACCAARAEIAGARVTIDMVGADAYLSDHRKMIAGNHPGLMVASDRAFLEQAFWNLFANSIEAGGQSEGGELRIAVEASIEGKEAIVILTDSNRGIDPALVTRLGRERITTKAEGTGLGLILVRRILAAQGGSLELFVAESGGLGARVRLPLAREAA
jgi:signal transduction histidine kinase